MGSSAAEADADNNGNIAGPRVSGGPLNPAAASAAHVDAVFSFRLGLEKN